MSKPTGESGLRYAHGEVPSIPARDLDSADLALLVTNPFVRRRYAAKPDDLAEFLVGTGVFKAAVQADSGKES
jgi:hypothetical protein